MAVLITGGAGFIGFSLAKHLIKNGDEVILIDNINNYYDVSLKNDRLANLSGATFYKLNLADKGAVEGVFKSHDIDTVVHLAAQAGVRYAKENPDSYIESNVIGFYAVISLSAKYQVKRFLYASSSSVYGANTEMPFSEKHDTRLPMSLYAATKLTDEAIAASYFFTHHLKTIGLRFFNVYGPWGRPDMAYYRWTTAIREEKELELRDGGEMWRDMTYIDDTVKAIHLLMTRDIDLSVPQIVNIASSKPPVKIADMLLFIAERIGVEPKIKVLPRGEEEPVKTWADISRLDALVGYVPQTGHEEGLKEFLDWYGKYCGE